METCYFLLFKTELHTKTILKRKSCEFHVEDVEVKCLDFFKMDLDYLLNVFPSVGSFIGPHAM